ncbi:MAG: hypothetical protein MZV70_03525 [Desulfobacterales bacterium]|nr:hypothetical protein [Desulfobacterales bacterium]
MSGATPAVGFSQDIVDSGANVYLDSNGDWQSTTTYITLPATDYGTWTEYKLSFTTHASYTSYQFILIAATTVGDIYFDDVSLKDSIIIGGANSVISQDVTTTASPTFAAVRVDGVQVVGARAVISGTERRGVQGRRRRGRLSIASWRHSAITA